MLNFGILCVMEYQSFFMLLKSYSFSNDTFVSTNPLAAQGYVQIKKEQQKYSVVVQLNNFIKPTIAYLVCKTSIAKIKLKSSCTIAHISFDITNSACLFIPEINLFACKTGTNGCQQAYNLLQNHLTQKNNKTTLEKIFGKVYDTYFFDCIKSKLASLFALGKPVECLNKEIEYSKWTSVAYNGEQKLFGIIYKNNFAYAIAVGSSSAIFNKEVHKSYKIDGKIYNILFLSASNGKIISF